MWLDLLLLVCACGVSLGAMKTKKSSVWDPSNLQGTPILNRASKQETDNTTAKVPVIGASYVKGKNQYNVILTEDKTTYNLYSPGFPDDTYPPNVQVYYDVAVQVSDPVAQVSSRIMITFEMFALEPSDFCSKDGLEISDPNYQTRVYCGGQSGRILLTEGSSVRIRFFSDAEFNERGFSLSVSLFPSSCTQTFSGQLQGSFSTPKFPRDYTNNELCVWKIQAPPGKRVRVGFNEVFNIQGVSPFCFNDYLEVSTTGDFMEDSERLCGDQAPPEIISEGNNLTLRFISDCCFQNRGFSASFTIIDGVPTPTPDPVIPSNCDCGKENVMEERIIDGDDVSPPHRFPWVVALYDGSQVLCGAGLISKRYAITAAHCAVSPRLAPDKVKILLGMFSLDDETQTLVGVDKYIIHPGFNKKTYANDIALIKFVKDVTFDHDISPICLPPGNFPTKDLPAIVCGWGALDELGTNYPRNLHMVEMDTLPLPKCKLKYGTTVTDQHLCAGGHKKDACQGDSGGPLFTIVDGRWMMVGVVSVGIGCGRDGYPGIFMNVPSYADWITENTQDSAACEGVEPKGPLQPNIQDCGLKIRHISTRVVGGTPSKSDYPWVAFIKTSYRDNRNQLIVRSGVGVLISSKFVVTALNWMLSWFPDYPDIFEVQLGRYDLQKDETSTAIPYRVTRVYVNPGYRQGSYDLELVLLELTVDVNTVFRPVCLPTSLSVPDDSPATAVGWGRSAKGAMNFIQQEIQVKTSNLSKCKTTYSSQTKVTDNMICAGDAGKGMCAGDAGSPLMMSQNGRYYLIGVASFGSTKGCAIDGYPDVYSAIKPNLDWISTITGLTVQ